VPVPTRTTSLSMAGKTGTARKPKVGERGYQEGAYVASFAGFVPAERPALTAIVILDEPEPIYGGITAAPAFAEIVAYALRHLEIPPVAATEPGAAAAVPPSSAESARAAGEAGAPGPAAPAAPGPGG